MCLYKHTHKDRLCCVLLTTLNVYVYDYNIELLPMGLNAIAFVHRGETTTTTQVPPSTFVGMDE